MTCTSYAESRRSRRGSVRTRPTISARCFSHPRAPIRNSSLTLASSMAAAQASVALVSSGPANGGVGTVVGRSFVTVVVADQGQWRIRVMLQCSGPYADAQCPGGNSKTEARRTEARRTVSASRRRAV